MPAPRWSAPVDLRALDAPEDLAEAAVVAGERQKEDLDRQVEIPGQFLGDAARLLLRAARAGARPLEADHVEQLCAQPALLLHEPGALDAGRRLDARDQRRQVPGRQGVGDVAVVGAQRLALLVNA